MMAFKEKVTRFGRRVVAPALSLLWMGVTRTLMIAFTAAATVAVVATLAIAALSLAVVGLGLGAALLVMGGLALGYHALNSGLNKLGLRVTRGNFKNEYQGLKLLKKAGNQQEFGAAVAGIAVEDLNYTSDGLFQANAQAITNYFRGPAPAPARAPEAPLSADFEVVDHPETAALRA